MKIRCQRCNKVIKTLAIHRKWCFDCKRKIQQEKSKKERKLKREMKRFDLKFKKLK